MNKCLIALVAKKLVTKRSENVSWISHSELTAGTDDVLLGRRRVAAVVYTCTIRSGDDMSDMGLVGPREDG